MTPQNATSSIANVTLIESSENSIITDEDDFLDIPGIPGDGSRWQCDCGNAYCKSNFCLELTIENAGCDGKENIDVRMHGPGGEAGALEFRLLWSVINSDYSNYNQSRLEYFSILHDWDGYAIASYVLSLTGGLFVGSDDDKLFQLEAGNTNASSIWSNLDTSYPASEPSWVNIHAFLVNENVSNWEKITDDRIKLNTSPLFYSIENDKINNSLSFYFDAATMTTSKENLTKTFANTTFDTFDTSNNHKIYFTGDAQLTQISQLDITVSCDSYTTVPTYNPTNIPTSIPSNNPSNNPSNIPSVFPSNTPTLTIANSNTPNTTEWSANLVTSNDVSYTDFSCAYGCYIGDNGVTYFKPQSRTVFEMKIEILLDTVDSVTLFSNDEQNISYTWSVFEWNETNTQYLTYFEFVMQVVLKSLSINLSK